MKTAIVYLLLVATLLPTVSPWGTIAYYQLNREYIARVLCQNRDKPQLHCDGACYLAKKLKDQQDRQDKETTERVQQMPNLQWFCQEYAGFSFSPSVTEGLALPQFSYQLATYWAPLSAIFQPPGLRA